MPATRSPARKKRARPPEVEPGSYADGVQLIERALSPDGTPVLGLYAHTLHLVLMRSLAQRAAFRPIMPHLLGTIAVLSVRPGLSQVEIANLLGKERATIGLQVTQGLKVGLLVRELSSRDKRRYELFVTAKGREVVAAARRAVPAHEALFAGGLTLTERRALRALLRKLIAAS